MNRIINVILLIIMIVMTGCVSTPKYQASRKPQLKWRVGDEEILESTIGVASFYGRKFAGRPTASGEIFNPALMTAAHKTWSFGTIVRVTNLKNNKSVVIKINDRGPFIEGRDIDLSRGSAERIGMVQDGVARVKMEILKWGEDK